MTGKQDGKKRKQPNLNDSDSTADDPSLSSRLSRRQHGELLPLPRFNFSVPAESVAQVFFFRHYSIAGAGSLYAVQGAAPLPTVKMLGILAVGMAGVANSERDHGVMALARAKYGSALHSINDAIRGREEATGEGTVAAVVLMAMFEMIACQERSSLEAWICHIQGAATLIRHWSKDDWKRTLNVRAFLHFFYLLAMGCLISRIPVPTHIQELARSSPAFKSDIHLLPAKQLFSIICRFADLHSSDNINQVTQITENVSTAMSIEEELLSWETHLPDTWRYSDPDKAHGGSCHVYACAWQAYLWNQYRICRILVHAVLLRYLDALDVPVRQAHPVLMAAYASQQEASRGILATMMLGIRASASYILGLYEKTKGSNALSPEHSGVFGLLGSMQALIGVVEVGGEDADWLCEMLEVMGSRWGIGQALVLGKYLRAKSSV
ncbi:uncharacterized protein TRIVIDRAFT_227033 [Trichoderma virens Gv29-8]|uniref:Transcription factor domain-containing protein n=1 Tax=Hypocrea virens (strain Gv29-8 / FGSC 10586) TaxID=413071 RepID=G9N879_HYPVG|nr:uncharacterized protein TRIVIDRAFT_227033 [Trichoderma virens Gv29-8]EHK17188.1 hypothetical protein TRIVIDRAFT_227033 [Trichoderma virens Gv29-8]UKZ55606.1 hypothetical protein TrVGV298_009430 [Trichoderma virens]